MCTVHLKRTTDGQTEFILRDRSGNRVDLPVLSMAITLHAETMLPQLTLTILPEKIAVDYGVDTVCSSAAKVASAVDNCVELAPDVAASFVKQYTDVFGQISQA